MLKSINKPIGFILFMILMGFSFKASSITILPIETDPITGITVDTDTVIISKSLPITESDSLKKNQALKKKRGVLALFAFPFPFGFVGAHRVMLGTKPWIPVLYVVTFGGCFGLIPLIDFCVITFSKDLEQYENNPHLFMWVK